MNNRGPQEEKRSVLDWKLIRIPRVVFRILVLTVVGVLGMAVLVLAIKTKGEEVPWLANLGRTLGIYETAAGEDTTAGQDVVESRYAKLIYVRGDVTVKPKQELRFAKATKGQILHEGDSIRTYSGAHAEVLFDEGNRLTIKPDSLVVIRDMKENRLTKIKKSSINLLRSDVEATIHRPKVEGSEFVINTPTAEATISNAKVAIQVSEAQASEVKVFQGTVGLKVGEQEVEVAQNQSVAVSKDARIEEIRELPPAPELLDPQNLAEFFFKRLKNMKADLKWRPVAEDLTYRLQVALDPYFSDLVIVRTALPPEGVAIQGLKSGIYYWRIHAVTPDGAAGDFSDYRVFKVAIDQTPPEIKLDDILLLKVSGRMNAQISGWTEADAAVTINGTSVTPDRTGRFKYILSKVTAGAVVSIAAEDRVGNRKVVEKTIAVP
jgi:hypothetical protein